MFSQGEGESRGASHSAVYGREQLGGISFLHRNREALEFSLKAVDTRPLPTRKLDFDMSTNVLKWKISFGKLHYQR